MENDIIFVDNLHSNCFAEFGTFACIQCLCFFFGQCLSVLIIFLCALDHSHRQRGVDRLVLVEVEDPFQAGGKVFCCAVRFFVGVDVHPLDPITQMEFPGQTPILSSPLVCDSRNNFTAAIGGQQAVPQVYQHSRIFRSLAVQEVEGFNLFRRNYRNNNLFEFMLCFLSRLLLLRLFLLLFCFFRRRFFGCFGFCGGAATTAQYHHSRQTQCQHLCKLLAHTSPPLVKTLADTSFSFIYQKQIFYLPFILKVNT